MKNYNMATVVPLYYNDIQRRHLPAGTTGITAGKTALWRNNDCGTSACLLLWTSSLFSPNSVEMPPICVILFLPNHSSSRDMHPSSPDIDLHHTVAHARTTNKGTRKMKHDNGATKHTI